MTAKNETTATFSAATGPAGIAKFNADIVDYATASAEQKAEMDVLIARLEASIKDNDLTVITSFDKEPSDRLGDTSEAILKEVQTANSFLGSFKDFGQKIKEFDFDGVGETAREYTESIARKMKLAAIKSPVLRFFKQAIGWVTGLGSKSTTAEDLRHQIDQSMLEFGEVIAELEEAKNKIPGLSKKLDVQEDARLEAYSEYGLYIGAALEVYRRMNEEVIPSLDAKAKETGSVLDAREARVKKVATTVLNKKLTGMDTFHKSCLVQLETIDDLKSALVMSELNINSHLTTSRNEWLAFLSESTSAATMSEIAEATQQADQFGDKIFEQSQSLSDLTTTMVRASFEHGAVDPNKVTEFLKKKAQNVLESVQYMEDANKRFEAKREMLDNAAAELLAAKASVSSTADATKALEEIKLIEADKTNALPVTPQPVKTPVARK